MFLSEWVAGTDSWIAETCVSGNIGHQIGILLCGSSLRTTALVDLTVFDKVTMASRVAKISNIL
jgi:hypothetical protein